MRTPLSEFRETRLIATLHDDDDDGDYDDDDGFRYETMPTLRCLKGHCKKKYFCKKYKNVIL